MTRQQQVLNCSNVAPRSMYVRVGSAMLSNASLLRLLVGRAVRAAACSTLHYCCDVRVHCSGLRAAVHCSMQYACSVQ
jgi:DNA repair protein RadC